MRLHLGFGMSFRRMDSTGCVEAVDQHNTSMDAALMAFANSCDNYAAKEKQAAEILRGSVSVSLKHVPPSSGTTLFKSVNLTDQRHKSRPHQFLVLESQKVPTIPKTLQRACVVQRARQKLSDSGYTFGNKYVESAATPVYPTQASKNNKRMEENEKARSIRKAQSEAQA